MLQAGIDHRALGADRLGRGLTPGARRAPFTVGVEEERRALATAGAVQLPVPHLGDGSRESADVGHVVLLGSNCEPEGGDPAARGPVPWLPGRQTRPGRAFSPRFPERATSPPWVRAAVADSDRRSR